MTTRRQLMFATSADYARHTGGWVYNTRLMRELAARSWDVVTLELPAGFPRPDAAARSRSAELLAGLPDGALVMADQICLSPLADTIERAGLRLRLVMLFHHPIAMEAGLPADERDRFARLETRALAACGLVIATSRSTAATLVADYGVAADRIVVAMPGIERLAPVEPRQSDVPMLLSVGAVIPRKGYDVLIEALAGLRDRPWRLDIVGDLDRAPDYVAALRVAIAQAGLDDRVVLRGGVASAALDAAWASADVYVSASRHEGYGMAVAEAIARGLPTVATPAGAIGEWLAPDAAVIVPDGSADDLREALARVLSQPALRSQLRAAALAQAARFQTWPATAEAVDRRLAAL